MIESKSKLKSGMLWSIAEVVIKRSLDFIVKLILARILFPEAFGIVGMAAVFTSFVHVLNDAGMSLAIIQKKEITHKHLNTAFWSNLIWSILLFILLSLVIAPLAVKLYDEPLLIKVIPIMSLSLIAGALNMVHYTLLRKNIEFKKIAFVRNISTLVAGVTAIILALSGAGIWALIANTVVAVFVAIPLYYKATKWKPRLEWDKTVLKEILSFGLFTTGTMVISNLVGNADYLLLGKWVGKAAVGAYSLAYMMTNSVMGQITTMIERVMYPFYSNIQNDIDSIKKYYLKIIKYYALAIFPFMLTLLLFADLLIPLFFGYKWIDTIIPVKILSVAIMINTLTTGYGLLFRSIGNPKFEFKIKRITSLYVYLPILIVSIYIYGIIGAAIGVLLSHTISFFIHQYILKKHFNIGIIQILSQNFKLILLTITTYLLFLILKYYIKNDYISLTIYILYFSCFYILFFAKNFLSILNIKEKRL